MQKNLGDLGYRYNNIQGSMQALPVLLKVYKVYKVLNKYLDGTEEDTSSKQQGIFVAF